jgi:hypothetical protein
VKLNSLLSRARLLDKSRAAYRRARRQDPSLAPMRSVAGKVEVKDAVRVFLPTVGGEVVYIATPIGGWRFEREGSGKEDSLPPVFVPAAAMVPLVATILDHVESDYDALINLVVGLERRLCDFEAGRFPGNVVHFGNGIAAE